MKKALLPLSVVLMLSTTQLSAFGLGDVANAVVQETAASQSSATASGLTGMLTQQLNISDKQASGGVGSILNYAHSSLTPEKFQTLQNAIPNAQSLMSLAPKSKSSANGALGALAGSMGSSSLSGMAALASQFTSLGLSSGMISKFVPVIVQYLKNSDSSEAATILSSLF